MKMMRAVCIVAMVSAFVIPTLLKIQPHFLLSLAVSAELSPCFVAVFARSSSVKFATASDLPA